MTLESIRNIVALNYDGNLPAEIFATHYDSATLKLFMQHYEAQNWEGLRGFKKVMGQGTPELHVNNGTAVIPPDYFGKPSAYYMLDGEPKLINCVQDAEFDKLVTHAYEFPTPAYPILNVQPSTIRVLPKSESK